MPEDEYDEYEDEYANEYLRFQEDENEDKYAKNISSKMNMKRFL